LEKKVTVRWKELPFLYKVQIWSYLLAGICGAIAYPLTTKLIYSSVDVDILAERLVLSSLIGIGLSMLWLNIQERLFKWFIWFIIFECLTYSLLIGYVILYQDFNSYLIMNTLISCTIGHIVNGGNSKLHQKITDVEQYRTDYCFFIEIVASIGVLVGSAVAVSFNVNMPIAFILLLVSLIGFQISDIYVYLKVTQREKNNN
jgi:hypothetical protein